MSLPCGTRVRPARPRCCSRRARWCWAASCRAGDSLEYLSGLLVGEELRCALHDGDAAAPVLVGDAALCARYRRALTLFDRSSQTAGDGAAAAGLWQIARQAGLC